MSGPDPRSGIDRSGRWSPAFEGQRRPFERGNGLSVKHEAYAFLRLAPRAAEIADGIRPLVPAYSFCDEPAVRTLALVFARVERAVAALDQIDDVTEGRELVAYTVEDAAKYQRLREDARGWLNTARRLMSDLGMTPTSRAKLGLDVARTQESIVELHRLAALEDEETSP